MFQDSVGLRDVNARLFEREGTTIRLHASDVRVVPSKLSHTVHTHRNHPPGARWLLLEPFSEALGSGNVHHTPTSSTVSPDTSAEYEAPNLALREREERMLRKER
jgi:hypothetical protein